ncbi:hypothetical protein COT54_02285 [Candidatus Collierbacteria bacterium CG09_land_8_20_14_0_10_46_12]|uniref:OmpR/PhoB-type domain-containing protein n=1 Tax=Candidatus Collierbacteria bacterium CG09_land_8_20_14_0_10_46_12 TaxID=1974533 RepID=A0A2H0WZ00_9BACT|nr:MAG: hypothetical protein COT54_02285 [Candidatus Collierbacteria bacterium CG09_land_8_20_14_0_10_46_12]
MKIIWDWSLDSETDRLLDVANGIGNGFFALQGFCPLPWPSTSKHSIASSVYLPSLNYISIPNFWSSVAKLDSRQYPLVTSKSLFNSTKSLLSSISLLPPNYGELERLTSTTVPQVINFIKKFISNITLPSELLIRPTHFGTGGSFSLIDDSGKITIYLRIDKGIKTIVECLLTSLLRGNAMQELAASWSETEFLTDWLITSSALSTILPADPTWESTLSTTRRSVSTALQAQSAHFLAQISAPTPTSQTFLAKSGQIYFGDCPLSSLTSREVALMTRLVAKSPAPLTLDEIGDLIFNQEDKFSLAAISKTIERLRTKLESSGISRHYLATASGVGYYLKN